MKMQNNAFTPPWNIPACRKKSSAESQCVLSTRHLHLAPIGDLSTNQAGSNETSVFDLLLTLIEDLGTLTVEPLDRILPLTDWDNSGQELHLITDGPILEAEIVKGKDQGQLLDSNRLGSV